MTWWDNSPTLTGTNTTTNLGTYVTIVPSLGFPTSVDCSADNGRTTKLVNDFAQTCRRRLEEIYAWSRAALKAARSLLLSQRLPALVFHDRALGRAGRSCSLSDKWRVRGPP